MNDIINGVLTFIFASGIIIGSLLITYLNLYCKDEIWESIYERMGWK